MKHKNKSKFLLIILLVFSFNASGQTLKTVFDSAIDYIQVISSGFTKIIEKESYDRLLRELEHTNSTLMEVTQKKQNVLLELKNYTKKDSINLILASNEFSYAIGNLSARIKNVDNILINQTGGLDLIKNLNNLKFSKQNKILSAIERWYLNGEKLDIDNITMETENILDNIYDLMKAITDFRTELIRNPDKYIK